MKNKKFLWLAVGIAVVILILSFLFVGFEFSIYGVCNFNTKYYNDPKTAFMKNETIDVNIEKDIEIVEIDSHNVMYIAKTSDYEILAAQMKRKDDKYFYVGYYSLFSDESFQQNSSETLAFQQNCMYKENGWFKCNFEYTLLAEQPQQNMNGYEIIELNVDSQQNMYFAYRIIE